MLLKREGGGRELNRRHEDSIETRLYLTKANNNIRYSLIKKIYIKHGTVPESVSSAEPSQLGSGL